MTNTTKELQAEFYTWMQRLTESTRPDYLKFVDKLEAHAKKTDIDAQAWRLLSEALISCPGRSKSDAVAARKRAGELSGGLTKKDRQWLQLYDKAPKTHPKNVQDHLDSEFGASKVGLTDHDLIALGKHLANEILGGRPEEVDSFHETRNWLHGRNFEEPQEDSFIKTLERFEIIDDYDLMELINELYIDESIIP